MKVHVEAKPLHEPLAGGTPGATVTVEPMVAGRVTWSRWMMESPGGRLLTLKLLRALISGEPAMSVPCPAFLIRHPSAGAVLVDTGLHPSVATGAKENFGGLGARFGKPTLEPGEDVPAQLRKRGLEPGEVPVVVMTHLHLDHASAISEFPQADLRPQRGRVGGRDRRAEPAPERLPPPPLRLRLRLPDGRLRPRQRRLLRELRPHPRPLRRRLDPPRLHPGPQRRTHVDRSAGSGSEIS